MRHLLNRAGRVMHDPGITDEACTGRTSGEPVLQCTAVIRIRP
jgi:hypothetical protein